MSENDNQEAQEKARKAKEANDKAREAQEAQERAQEIARTKRPISKEEYLKKRGFTR